MADYRLGQTVVSHDGRNGIIRFKGTASFASGEWIGLELPDDSGKNDGSVKGERYFQCKPGHGIFIRKEAIAQVVRQPTPSTTARPVTKPTTGTTLKPRPSSVVSADTARKRQSLMGSSSTPGSRLSVRSPTKSPSKLAFSSASSATSTPRTGTPATTARISDSSSKSRVSTNGRSSMAPPSTKRPPTHTSRPSIGGPSSKNALLPAVTQSRLSTAPSRGKNLEEAALKDGSSDNKSSNLDLRTASPGISTSEEEDKSAAEFNGVKDSSDVESVDSNSRQTAENAKGISSRKVALEPTILAHVATPADIESQAAQRREIESLKAKVRTLEKKRLEDREALSGIETLRADKERHENVIQALQRKLKATLQDIAEYRSKCDEAESRAKEIENANAEHESEIELATLDKEMAEERAENMSSELEALKLRYEELELEAEILREENKEMGSGMTSDERANAGWLQMQKENERLRQALVMLRDMSQQNEIDLKDQVKELQDDVTESESLKAKFQETSQKLSKIEATNKHLMEQLEAAESNEDVAMALEHEKEANLTEIAELKEQLQVLQEEIQINDELESYHLSTEKELQRQVDEAQALLYEKHTRSVDQDHVIEDLEYTLTKFRDVVAGLQRDIDDLRRSKDITEVEAHEMSSKSRAMMDLNLQLQNSAAKTQMKTIDVELGKIRAEESACHLEIVQGFVPDSYDTEKNPVLALLCVKRIASKAALIQMVLRDRTRDRPHLTADEPFAVFDVTENLAWLGACCERFTQFMSFCAPADFSKLNNLAYELEPVERAMNGWIEALRRDELSRESSAHLSRMKGILSDLAEKFIPENIETQASRLSSHASMVEAYSNNMAIQMDIIVKTVESKLGNETDLGDDLLHLDKKMDQLTAKARTVKYVTGKVSYGLDELHSRSMCPEEPAWALFEESETLAKELSKAIRDVGLAVSNEILKEDPAEPVTFASVTDTMTNVMLSLSPTPPDSTDLRTDDAFALLGSKLQILHNKVGTILLKTQDLSTMSEFERSPAPWTVRAKEIKSQKIISPDVQEELSKLQTRTQEQLIAISGKDRVLEEQQIKIELLESRSKEAKDHAETMQRLENEVRMLQSDRETSEQNLQQARDEHRSLLHKHEEINIELAAMKKAHREGSVLSPSNQDETVVVRLTAEVRQLHLEIESLHTAVRWLKSELHRAQVPVSTSTLAAEQHAWLDPINLQRRRRLGVSRSTSGVDPALLKKEATEVMNRLLDAARDMKPILVRDPFLQTNEAEIREHGDVGSRKISTWRAMRDSPKYQVLKQRETMQKWDDSRDDLLRRFTMATHGRSPRDLDRLKRDWKQAVPEYRLGNDGELDSHGKSGPLLTSGVVTVDGIEIVNSSP